MGDRLIFQLGTNNWQRGGEFAPGSGILHEAHHHAYNALPGLRCYSMYPSRRQRFREEDVRVFAIEHVFVSGMAERDGGKLRALLRCGYLMVGYAWLRFIGMKRTELVRENSN